MGGDTSDYSCEIPNSPGFVRDGKNKPLPRKIKLLTAAAIFYGNIAFGCAFNTYGPALTSLQNKYNTDAASISHVFSILTASILVGSLLGGIIFDHVNRQFAVIAIVAVKAAMIFLTPFCPTITWFFVSAGIMGLCSGFYDTAQIVWMLEMMQKECPPYVQAAHFFYAIGANLGSLIMAPFLDGKKMDNEKIINVREGEFEEEKSYDKLFIPYTIVGFLIILGMIFQIILFTFFRYYAPPAEVSETTENRKAIEANGNLKEVKKQTSVWSWPKFRLVILSCCYYGAYQAMEMCTFQFFPKFCQNSDLGLSESESAYVLTGMTAAFAVGRGIGIVAVFKISTQLILCVNIALICVANILLIGWAKSSLILLWSSSLLFGLGFSSMYASFCAYIERYLNFTNFIGSLMIVCGSGVAAIYPLVVGKSIEKNPIVLSYTTFFSIGVIIFSFGSASYLTFKNKTRY